MQMHTMSDGTVYDGRNPIYTEIKDPKTGLSKFIKTAKGVPFVKVKSKNGSKA